MRKHRLDVRHGARTPRRMSGVSLIEVLVSIVVASIGLLALAGVNAAALRYAKMTQYRAVATQMASDIADRMRANKGTPAGGFMAGSYDLKSSFSPRRRRPPACRPLHDRLHRGTDCRAGPGAMADLRAQPIARRGGLPREAGRAGGGRRVDRMARPVPGVGRRGACRRGGVPGRPGQRQGHEHPLQLLPDQPMSRRPSLPMRKQRGISLVELMVSLVIGLLVVGAVLISYLSASQASAQRAVYSRMNDDAQIGLSIISRDLMLAGYSKPTGVSVATGRFSGTPPIAVFGCDKGFAVPNKLDELVAATDCATSGDSSAIEVSMRRTPTTRS